MDVAWAAVWVAGGSLFVAALALVAAGLSAKFARDQRDLARAAHAQLANERAASAAAPWMIEHHQNDAFALVNRGLATLFDVEVLVPFAAVGVPRWDMIDAAAAETFLVPQTEAMPGSPSVEVHWAETSGGVIRSWRTTLPSRR